MTVNVAVWLAATASKIGWSAIDGAIEVPETAAGPAEAQPAKLQPTCTVEVISVAPGAVELLLIAVQSGFVLVWLTGSNTRLSWTSVVRQFATQEPDVCIRRYVGS